MASTLPSVPEASPPWGAFPAEQYLLLHWDSASAEPAPDQRRRLIRDFVQVLDDIPPPWLLAEPPADTMTSTPSEAQVREILAPWRPLRWRSAAWQIWRSRQLRSSVWLRTHYADDEATRERDGARLREWFETDDDYDANTGDDTAEKTMPWRVLDDASLFNFGDQWDRVFEVLPELAGPQEGSSRRLNGAEGSEARRWWSTLCQGLREAVSTLDDPAEKLEAVEGGGNLLQIYAVDSYLLVADEVAFRTDDLCIVFLDCRGNYVRQSRIRFDDDVWTMGHVVHSTKLADSDYWDSSDIRTDGLPGPKPGGVLNPKYRALGELGRVLYGIEDLL